MFIFVFCYICIYLFSLDIYSLVQQPLEEGRYPNSRDRQRLQGRTESPETSGSHLRRESPRSREGQPQNTFGKQCRKGSGVPKIQRHEACWNARGRYNIPFFVVVVVVVVVVVICFIILDIVDGNLTMTLGMIWTIILRFAIKDISVGG